MAITKLGYKDHEEWLALRAKYIGGSDAGSVVGLNPYKSSYALWAEKTGKVPAFEGNLVTSVGAYLEEFVAHLFERETGLKVRKSNFTYINDEFPFACANVDRLIVGEKALLEIKTTNSLPRMRKIRGGEFPDEWYCQMTHYLAVTGLKKAYLAVLVECREFHVFELDRDQAEIDSLMAAEKDFWQHVTDDTAPDIDGTKSTSDAIGEIYPESDGSEADLRLYTEDLSRYCEIGEQIKALKALQDESANRIKDFMGASAKGSCDGYKVSWSCSERHTFDSKAFLKENPGDWSEYDKVTAVRTFKITKTA